MSKTPQKILLDTHIWIWLLSGVEKAVSPKLRSLVEDLTPSESVRVSAISAWEVGMLVAKKRISFTMDVKEWVYRALRAPGIGVEPVGPDIAIESTCLPEDFHGDPADRILIATAKHIGATLITHDKQILRFAKKHNFPALDL